ncbi:MAG: hypothetical protein WCT17_00125 [Bacilli bacterium]
MTKKSILKKGLWFYVFSWTGNLLLFLFILLIPKNELLYQISFYIFVVCGFIIPLGLGGLGIAAYYKKEDLTCWKASCFPLGASVLVGLSTFIFFIETLVVEKQVLMMEIGLGTIGLFLGIVVGLHVKKLPHRFRLGLMVVSLLVYLIFLYVAMKLSYSYSIVW